VKLTGSNTSSLNSCKPFDPVRQIVKRISSIKWCLKHLDLLRPELDNRNIELVKELDDDLPDTPFDRSQIKQVFVNLIKNAMQAISKKGF
jgi:nitrogen-specific signal transduction histidine kinase